MTRQNYQNLVSAFSDYRITTFEGEPNNYGDKPFRIMLNNSQQSFLFTGKYEHFEQDLRWIIQLIEDNDRYP